MQVQKAPVVDRNTKITEFIITSLQEVPAAYSYDMVSDMNSLIEVANWTVIATVTISVVAPAAVW